ncbi:response regulator [Paenibacillus sp. KQZ6P-2]|uniref:Response regulator n=1 Tax=Paenibacillus mangrovi TaxID=2931978 RepID=A0A9X1WNC9_9BACL|nr:response regulator [Paenibacillus mangrovi]MCJ8010990.1 response regulator [Paenibacillus mangrovi]
MLFTVYVITAAAGLNRGGAQVYKVILIDDEDEVREGIRNKISWNECGFELIGEYDNGRDALEAIDIERPDLIITDICMAFMDGLDLARIISERYRDMKVVIITGYEDFDYAKQAITYRVQEYLLKPINAREFTSLMLQMKAELDAEWQQRRNLSQLRIQLNESLPLLRERFMERLVFTRISREMLQRKLDYFQIRLKGPSYIALVMDLGQARGKRELRDEQELLQYAAYNIVQEQLEQEGSGIAFRTRDDRLAVILQGTPEHLEMKAQWAADQARSSLDKYLRLPSSVGIGRRCDALEDISSSYQEALSSLDYTFLLGEGRVISIQDVEFGHGIPANSADFEQQLISSLKSGNIGQVSSVIQGWFHELKTVGISVIRCRSILYQILIAMMKHTEETGLGDTNLIPADAFSKVGSFRTLDEAQSWIEDISRSILVSLTEHRSSHILSQMDSAEAYIRANYHDEGLSLQQVCNHLFMSTSYFSSLFKQHTGGTFVEYVTRIRMEKAKELLCTTRMKSYEIAEKVGYSDPQYFSVLFKRNNGKTPKEYRQHQQESVQL